MSAIGHLFQARLWREYVRAWDGKATSTGINREWVENILRVSRKNMWQAQYAFAASS
jgi:hypothetical protein